MLKNNSSIEITICSVYHSEASKKLLELNYDLVKQLNPGVNFIWIVADNSPADLKEKIDADKFLIVPGAGKLADNIPAGVRGSYHHAVAINSSLKYVKTRFVLILDNDFYIVRSIWIKDIIEYMKKNNLSFLGSPWHPRLWKKIRYFPGHFSLFIDLNKINIKDLDFTPQYDEISYRNILTFKNRGKIGLSRDTGYALYRKYYKNSKIKYECVLPVLKPYKNSNFVFVLIKKIIKSIIPDKWLYVPKRSSYYSEIGFSDLGYFDVAAWNWEEFMWKNKPFGFHLRGTRKTVLSTEEKIFKVKDALNSFSNL
ncbi:MAG: hypothetical protein Athens071426_139 [Parcubacteria group bacterium Athens0714_26]|nr:MAG: hypothetical protein Athens101426_65 [Parcubacteria group bacterium Athens1014_26]TSD03650.1 MAG: hypothetical protein Athens071426_139 [Parcubacteria group bacterium Athens0714_26]